MPLRLNVDQVSRSDEGSAGGGPRCPQAWEADLPLPLPLPLQDALLFLKDFFSSLAAGIHPLVSVETSADGERLSWDVGGRFRASHLAAIPRPIPNVCPYHPTPSSL